jgi:hypothetical protein
MVKAAKPRLGVGFDDPGCGDVYADATPCCGLVQCSSMQASEFAAAERTLTKQHSKVLANPAAGTVRQRELECHWMTQANTRIAAENSKARALCQEKRVLGLAKQTVAGLAAVGVAKEMTEIAIKLRLAFEYRSLTAEEQAALPEGKRRDMLLASQLLDAVLIFDSVKAASLLQLKLPQVKTYGDSAPL